MFINNYILACDERGTTRCSNTTNTWAYGGFIFNIKDKNKILRIWQEIKQNLCENSSAELKWSHFFDGKHQEKIENPLISTNPKEWRNQAIWALDNLFNSNLVIPLTTYVRKDNASDSVFITNSKGNKILDINVIWVSVLGQFSLFLKNHNSTGQVWCDSLGSKSEEDRRKNDWINLREGEWKINPENQKTIQRIHHDIVFLNSKDNGIIQIADFLSGVIWAASENDDEFLQLHIENYQKNNAPTYLLSKIQ